MLFVVRCVTYTLLTDISKLFSRFGFRSVTRYFLGGGGGWWLLCGGYGTKLYYRWVGVGVKKCTYVGTYIYLSCTV